MAKMSRLVLPNTRRQMLSAQSRRHQQVMLGGLMVRLRVLQFQSRRRQKVGTWQQRPSLKSQCRRVQLLMHGALMARWVPRARYAERMLQQSPTPRNSLRGHRLQWRLTASLRQVARLQPKTQDRRQWLLSMLGGSMVSLEPRRLPTQLRPVLGMLGQKKRCPKSQRRRNQMQMQRGSAARSHLHRATPSTSQRTHSSRLQVEEISRGQLCRATPSTSSRLHRTTQRQRPR
mmetsp:Transcript_77463/g.250638  ORF Transcript_77463/g.250638 Transcript_77463/m.250638 type:complete len:231 (+) Transcript_77463:2616-3308(+)